MNTPKELRYAASHEWTRVDDDDHVTVGISDYAQDQLGDVVFVELPEVGKKVRKGAQVAVVESVKTASDIYAPVSGTVTEVNVALEATPEALNEDPYEEGWMFRLQVDDASELDDLLDASDYEASIAEED